MRYSYEFKRKCVDMYRHGQYPPPPEGLSKKEFHYTVRKWARMEDANGPEVLRHNRARKAWTPEEKLEVISQVLAGNPNQFVAINNGLSNSVLYNWVRNYKIYGYNGLINKKKGRKSKDPEMKKVGTRKPPNPNESEYEELVRLRAENEYMRAEIEVIKKEIALREEKEAARLKAKKQQSSKNSVPKDSN